MAQYKKILTSAAKSIVVNFFEAEMKKDATSTPSMQLMASLYSVMPEAEAEVVEVLKEYIVDLKDTVKLENEPVAEDRQYDYIFTFPPMVMGVKRDVNVIEVIRRCITKQLANNGEMYCILPIGFCNSNGGWGEVRNILRDSGRQYSVLVISLPPLMSPITNVGLCLLRIKKDNAGTVTLMDAFNSEGFYAKEERGRDRGYILNTQAVVEALRKHDERYVWEGTTEQLSDGVNLLPARYLVSRTLPSPKAGEKRVRLSEVVTIVETAKRTDKQECPIVGMRELSNTYLNCDIDVSALERQEVATKVITTDCLLVGFIGGKFKVGRLHGATPETPVALRNEVVPIKVTSNDITEDFLLRSITTEMSEVQARALAVGSVLTRLSRQDLLRIEIDVPDTGEQDALCKEDSRNSLTDADRRIIESHEEFRKDMHIKKHAIGQTLFNLNNWWDALQQAREEGNGVVSDSATTGRVRKVSVATIYDNIQKALNQLQEQISRFDRGNGLVTEEVGLTDFIEKYIETHRSPMFRYEYDATRHHVQVPIFDEKYDADGKLVSVVIKGKEEDIFESATFAPEALRMVFDNIVSNACSHGFAGREDKPERNVIRIELSTEGTNHIITISNNGKPADSVVNSDFVFTYSKSTQSGKEHNGIGGYEVKRLMQEFGGEAEFVSDPESEFPVSYRLTFYNTNVLTIY